MPMRSRGRHAAHCFDALIFIDYHRYSPNLNLIIAVIVFFITLLSFYYPIIDEETNN